MDIAELGGSVQITPTEKRLADSIEKIERHLGHFANGFSRLHVETQTTAERRAEEAERLSRWERESAAAEEEDERAS